jgi:hypothetical protein
MNPFSAPGASGLQGKRLAGNVGNGGTNTKWNSYFSRCRITSNSLTADQYIVSAGQEVTAFGYARGNDMTAGGQPGYQAKSSDTNIVTPSQTIAGENVVIYGIGINVGGMSDANLLKQLDPNVSVKLRVNSTTDYLLGTPSMLPSPSGLFGSSEAWSVAPSLPDQVSRNIGAMSNGVPHASNFFPFPEPFMWYSAGNGDSNVQVILRVENQVATIAQFSSVARAAATGVAPYTPPTAAQTWVDWMIILIGQTVLPESVN